MIIDSDELRAELARRSWSRRELAARAGLSESYIRWVCRGARASKRATQRILGALGAEGAARVLAVSVEPATPSLSDHRSRNGAADDSATTSNPNGEDDR